MRLSPVLTAALLLPVLASCTSTSGKAVPPAARASAAPSTASTTTPPVAAVTRDSWATGMSAVCRQQAALTPTMASPDDSAVDDVEVGVRQLSEAARTVDVPAGDTEVSEAYTRLDAAAGTWLDLATATSTTATARAAGSTELRAAVQSLVAAGAADCARLST